MGRDDRVGAARRCSLSFIAALVLLFSFGPRAARAEIFTEDFSSLAYCDTAQTTACWDPVSGTLHLYPYAPRVEASLPIGKAAFCCVRAGDRLYVGESDIGLRIVDITDIHHPAYVGGTLMLEAPLDLAVDGDRLFVAAHSELVVVDISGPDQFAVIGRIALVEANAVAMAGEVAWLTSCAGGLYAVDVSVPAAPVLLSQTATVSCAQNLAIHGDHAYVCTGYLGFSVFDISDPAAPVQVAQVPGSYEPRRIRVAGNLAFVAELSGELLIYSLADPAAPALLGACALPGHAQDVALSGGYAYVAVGDPDLSAFAVVDVADPAAPQLLRSDECPGFPVQLELFGEYALVNAFTQLLVVRIAEAVTPVLPETPPIQPTVGEFTIDGDRVYAVGRQVGDPVFLVFSLETPAAPTLLGSCPLPGSPSRLAWAPPLAYLPTYERGYMVVDASDPAEPALIADVDLDCSGMEALAYGDYLFLGYSAGGPGAGLLTLDVSDPAAPQLLSDLPLAYSPRDLCRHGDWLYAIQWEDGEMQGRAGGGTRQSEIGVIDISDPLVTHLAATFAVPEAYVEYLRIDGDLLFAAFWSFDGMYGHGVVVLDISDPLAPRELGRFTDGGGFGQVALAGDLAFTGGWHRIDVLDISDPTAPLRLHSLTTSHENIWLGQAGDYLYAAGGYSGLYPLRIFDRSVDCLHKLAQSTALPASETPISHARMHAKGSPGVLWEFSADDGAHWQTLTGPGQWLHLAHPGATPRWRASLPCPESGAPLPVVDLLALEWIADPTAAGSESPPVFALQPPAPNPFNPMTTLRFELPADCRAQVTLYDVAGRPVRQLLDAALPAGRHDLRWDGRDDAGAALPSGIYVCRLAGGGREAARKLVLIR